MLKVFNSVPDLIFSSEVPHVDKVSNYCKDNVLLNATPLKKPCEFNEKGYRSDPFFPNEGIKVLSIGCSDVFGYSLEKKHRFSDVFCNRISSQGHKVLNWNLGLPGKSNDYIARTISFVQSILKPDIVLVSFTRILRREWFSSSGICIDHIYKHKTEASGSFNNLSNYNQDILNFYINYKLIESVLKDVNFMFTLSLNTSGDLVGLDDILRIVDTDKYVGYFDVLDYADDHHPGKNSNFQLADRFFEKYKAKKE
jgi:hypothetical protein